MFTTISFSWIHLLAFILGLTMACLTMSFLIICLGFLFIHIFFNCTKFKDPSLKK